MTFPTQRISYGINVDIACNTFVKTYAGAGASQTNGFGYYTATNTIGVYKTDGAGKGITPANSGSVTWADTPPLNGLLSKVRRASEVLLFADSGTTPRGNPSYALDDATSQSYTTNYIVGNTSTLQNKFSLAGVADTSWLGARIPIQRHSGKSVMKFAYTGAGGTLGNTQNYKAGRINVCFADGHCASVGFSEFNQVFVSPYLPNN